MNNSIFSLYEQLNRYWIISSHSCHQVYTSEGEQSKALGGVVQGNDHDMSHTLALNEDRGPIAIITNQISTSNHIKALILHDSSQNRS